MAARDLSPSSQWTEPQTGTRVASPVYIVATGAAGRWQFSTTGPAGAYLKATGTGGRYEIDASASTHDTTFFQQVVGTTRVIIR